MGFFDNKKNVQEYIDMVEEYDGTEIIETLRTYLPKNSTVLELGMGPGKDLDLLSKYYNVTGSDSSQIFIDRYKKNHPKATVIKIDATDIKINQKYDCIFSNKVLIHLTKDECQKSFHQQKEILNSKGILFHTFWHGDKIEKHHDLLFTYYSEDELKKMVEKNYTILKMDRYTEFKENDSILMILQLKN